MTISTSLNAGVAGLSANAARLATISDNIANSSTYGYKRASAEFESLVLSSARGAATYSAGGVRASTQRLIEERGALIGTSNALDLAVAGRGMLPVIPATSVKNGEIIGSEGLIMTTTGAFRTDANGVLRTESGLVLLGWPASANGDIPTFPRDTIAGLQPVVIPSSQVVGDPTTNISLSVNLPAMESTAGASGDPIPMSVEYYGNIGNSEMLEISYTPVILPLGASNTWNMEIRDGASGGAVVGLYQLTFDDTRGTGGALAGVTAVTGAPYNTADGNFILSTASGPITMEIGRIGDPSGMTQLARAFTPTSVRDGSPVGNLTSVEVDGSGYVMASYDTGFIRRIYQIPVIDVPNLNALQALDNQTFGVTPDSGPFFLWNAGEGPTGSIKGYAREGSATDVAGELTALITTQRAYSSNAKVIQTVDEMLQETTNIKR